MQAQDRKGTERFRQRVRCAAIILVVALLASACVGASSVSPSAAATDGGQGGGSSAGDAASSPSGDLGAGRFSRAGWRTDFARHSVPFGEIESGGPPKDGIPSVDRPAFVTVSQAESWLKPVEPVVALDIGGDARAYPLQILIWHEIVNGEVGGVPVVVTFCPLCNTAIAFERRLGDRTLDFGTTGNLRLSDLVMYDRQTESWWQQAIGEAIVGELTGQRLTFVPAAIVSFQDFRSAHPLGKVLSKDTGMSRDYGRNPYVGYDDISSSPFLFSGKYDRRLQPMERVVAVSLGGLDRAYPFSVLERRRVIHDAIGDAAIVVFHAPGTASALDQEVIALSRDVGATGVYHPAVDGRSLTFATGGGGIVDRETGSTWNVLGHATAGSLAGKRLAPVVHGNHFWFAWAAFKPQTQVYQE